MRLTKDSVGKLVLPTDKADMLVFDDKLAGFGIRLRAGGKRTWFAQYRIGTKQRRLSLGSSENLDADEARKRAKDALSKAHLGIDPQTEKFTVRLQAAETVKSAVASYLSRSAEKKLKPGTLTDVRRYLRVHWAPIQEVALQSVTRGMVASRLNEIAVENGPFAANRARAALSALFSWAIGEGLAGANPVVGTNKATAEISRDRVLSPFELRLAWDSAGGGDYGAILKLLILTGQRREEVAGMLWSEIDVGHALWSIDPSRTKNGQPHDVPLAPAAVEILGSLPRRDGRELVFGSSDGPFQGFSNAKSTLDDRMKAALKEAAAEDPSLRSVKILPWRLHDIRRTVATRLGDQGVLPHVVEAILNHISGHKAGVAGTYNRSVYGAEKRAALEAWAKSVAITGKAA